MKQLSSLLGLDPNDLVDNRLTEFLDPEIARANNQVRTFSNIIAGVDPDSYGAETANFAAGATARGIESLRRGLSAQNDRYATPAELFQQRTQGLDTTSPVGRIMALQAASDIDSSQAKSLADAFIAQDIANQSAIGNRVGVSTEIYDDGSVFTQSATGAQRLITKDGILTDPQKIAAKRAEIVAAQEASRTQATVNENLLLARQNAVLGQIESAQEQQDQVYNRLRTYDSILENLKQPDSQPSALASLFPALLRDNATNEFYTLTNSLGLDVIAGTTFGALSESELRFALQTAVPPLSGKEAYQDYFERKKAVEQKLLRELLSYQNFLQTTGMPTSMAGFMSNEQTQAAFTGQQGKAEARQTIPEEYLAKAESPRQLSDDDLNELNALRGSVGGTPNDG